MLARTSASIFQSETINVALCAVQLQALVDAEVAVKAQGLEMVNNHARSS